jgi:hypothetical protein
VTTAIRERGRLLARCARALGFEPKSLVANVGALPKFVRALAQYNRQNTFASFKPSILQMYPILHDHRSAAGEVTGHYFRQDLWAARKVFERRPESHVDIGSRIDGFIAHLLVFMPVTLVDLRPLDAPVPGLNFIRDNATTLACFPDRSVQSLSSLHAAEHFGLGRYGDPIDPIACFLFMRSLARVLQPGGWLYFSVPVGRERVEFNAHRVFEIGTVLKTFADLQLYSFSLIDDEGRLREGTDPTSAPATEFGCGLFEFTKPQRATAY